jgi:DNA-binding winged helix-turn-helix (wHTH) protein
VRFANFEVDLRAGELPREGSRVRRQEQPFLLLAVVFEYAGEVVTREELRKRLWSADTFVDFDHRLAVAVSKLRDALRDSAEKLQNHVAMVAIHSYTTISPESTRR